MRHLFSVIVLVFVQLISQQYAWGREGNTSNTKGIKENAVAKFQYYKLGKKRSTSFKKTLFEDAPFVHSSLKKSGFDYPLSFGISDDLKPCLVLTAKIYTVPSFCRNSLIFDYLYPKHVFW